MRNRLVIFTLFLASQAALTLAQDQTQICVPQFVDGALGPYRWQTSLILQNQDQTQAQARLHFLDNNGQPLSGILLRERLGQGQQMGAGSGGQLETVPINGRTMRSYRSESMGPLQAGYVLIESQNRIQAHAMLHLYDAQGNLVSETGIIPGPQFRSGGFLADQTDGKGLGLALLNPSAEQAAMCSLELYEEDGETPLGTVDVELAPRAQIARILLELFPELLTGEVGFVRVSCDSPVCALALQLRGLQMLQIPVFVENGDSIP